MGCELSKLDNRICKKSETHQTHVNFIKKHGMSKYNEVMGIGQDTPNESVDKSIDNHSSSFNLGLVNLESSSETESTTANVYEELTWRQILEITVGCMITIYIIVKIKQFMKKRSNKRKLSKSVKMSEIVKNATSIPTAPPPPPPPPTPFPTNFTIAIPPKKLPLAPIMQMIDETPAITFPNRLYD